MNAQADKYILVQHAAPASNVANEIQALAVKVNNFIRQDGNFQPVGAPVVIAQNNSFLLIQVLFKP